VSIAKVEVRLPSLELDRSYRILIDPDEGAEERLADEIHRRAGGARIGLLTDETVAGLHWPRIEGALTQRGLRVATVVVPDGENSKSLGRAELVAQAWAKAGLDRKSIVVALGGGVVGDLGGFVASVFLRGVPYVQVPTTLLAQVDSSVGGKTGVNLPSGKNLVGTFYQPMLVYADLTTLQTLDARDIAAGLAELVKHGAIADAGLFELIEQRVDAARAGDPGFLAQLIARSCAIKAEIVAADERETAIDLPGGGRARLNFGHTVGHAIESASAHTAAPLRHGEAVGLGMLAAARLGAALGLGDRTLEARLTSLCHGLGLPTDLDRWLTAAVLERVTVDKKRAGNRINLILVDRLGSSLVAPVEPQRIGEILLGEKRR
jgi:3-dehydroquinate synthase